MGLAAEMLRHWNVAMAEMSAQRKSREHIKLPFTTTYIVALVLSI
jgi:hypothetical protein